MFFDQFAKKQAQHHGWKKSNEHVENKALRFDLVPESFGRRSNFFPIDQDDGKDSTRLNSDVKNLGFVIVKTKQGTGQNQMAC